MGSGFPTLAPDPSNSDLSSTEKLKLRKSKTGCTVCRARKIKVGDKAMQGGTCVKLTLLSAIV